MKSDRELLEAAAKAGGIRYDAEKSTPHPTSGAFWGLWLLFDSEPSEYARRYWNPLTDDGDALRLAVKLRLDVIHDDPEDNDAWVMAGSMDHVEDVTGESSRPAATRRAIVRAAAAVGEGLVPFPTAEQIHEFGGTDPAAAIGEGME